MKRKIISAILCVAMALEMVSCTSIKKSSEKNQDFEEFCQEIFIDNLKNDAFTAHFQIADVSKYGIEYHKDDYNLGECNLDYIHGEYEKISDMLDKLRKFDRDSLSEEQKITYDTLEDYFETNAMYSGLELYQNMFGISQGLVSNLSTNFVEFVFYDKEDVDEYLCCLMDVSRYVDDALGFLEKQSEEGLFMPVKVAEQVIDQCNKYINAKEEPLLITFENKISQLDGLSDEEKDQYIRTNEEYVDKYYKPVYKNIKNKLEELKDTSKNQGGLCGFGEDGKKYYQAIVRDKTSTDISPDELIDYLDDAMSDLIKELNSIVLSDVDAYYDFMDYQADVNDPSEVLEYVLDNMNDDFMAPVTDEYSIEYQLPVCEVDGVLAYYVSSRIDDISINNIKVNSSAVADDTTTLYTTMAHEGFPGHLYQFTSMYANDNICDVRKTLDFIGVTEGWAEYASDIAMDYLTDCSDNVKRLIQINDMISYIVGSRLDLGVNYEGWDYEDAYDYLSDYYAVDNDFDNEDNTVVELYTQAAGDPGVYLPYTVGHLMMDDLKEQAQDELGKKFDLKSFNTWIIGEMGITSFDVYSDNLDDWIKSQK